MPAKESSKAATTSGTPGAFQPEDSLVVIQCELDGKPVVTFSGIVLAADSERGYVALGNFRTREQRAGQPAPKSERFVALFGPPGSERRVELEQMAYYPDSRCTILAAPKARLPAPLPMTGFPYMTEGEELRYIGARINNERGQTSFERVTGPIRVGKIVSDPLGRPLWITMVGGMKGLGLLTDAGGRVIALCAGSGEESTALPTEFLKSQLNTQLGEMRIRVTPHGEDDVVLDFALQTFDPFSSGLAPKLLVSHPSILDSRKPDHEKLHGVFLIEDGVWAMPPEGTVVELAKAEAFDAALEIPPAPNAWSRETKWVGTYRFRRDEKFLPVWYQPVLVDGSGKIKSILGGESHVKVRSNDPQPILFRHPVSQYEAGKPIAGGAK